MGSRAREKRREGHRSEILKRGRPQMVELEPPQLPKPRVTGHNITTVVPVFPHGDAGPHQGSRGVYEVVLILGVPGRTSAMDTLNFDTALAGGDSLLLGSHVKLGFDAAGVKGSADVIPNDQGRLAQVRASIEADNFENAERQIYNAVAPALSLIAFRADVALEVTGILTTERSTQIRRFGATMLGTFQPAPAHAGNLPIEVRPLLAAYREGSNSTAPMYQALSFCKIIESVKALSTRRGRHAARKGVAFDDPLLRTLPDDLAKLDDQHEWERVVFAPYLGKSYAGTREELNDTIRNAVAHLSPGRDIRSGDLFDDIEACRLATPVLRYIARALITDELDRGGGSPNAAHGPDVLP